MCHIWRHTHLALDSKHSHSTNMSYKDLQGKTIIVTGAASGMGRATAIMLAKQGVNVGLLDLRSPDQLAEEIRKDGGKCLPMACNVQRREEVDTAVKAVVDEFGELYGGHKSVGSVYSTAYSV